MTDPRFRRWQFATLAGLFAGYVGYYVCRSNFSVAGPLLLAEYGDAGLEKKHLGDLGTLGIVAYFLGKLLCGAVVPRLGGRAVFVGGMVLSALFTLLLAASGALAPAGPLPGGWPAVLLPLGVAWGLNRFVQAFGWAALVDVAARWTPPGRVATVMGALSLSFLLGDAAARLYLGAALRAGYGWRELFVLAAATLAALAVGAALVVRNRPADRGLPPPEGAVAGPDRLPAGEVFRSLARRRAFWAVCAVSAGLTLVRETFLAWTPIYFIEVLGLDAATAAAASSVFPLAGAFAAATAGWLVDRLGGDFGRVARPSLALLALAIAALAVVPPELPPGPARTAATLALVAVVALTLIAPYSFCAGAMAVRLGGPAGGAAASGLIDAAGYAGAVLSGSAVGRLIDAAGWRWTLLAVAGAAALTLLAALVPVRGEER